MSTLKDFETGKRAPMRNNLEALRSVLEAAGVGLLFDDVGCACGITITASKGGALADQPMPKSIKKMPV